MTSESPATNAPPGTNFTPVNVVVLQAGRIRYRDQEPGGRVRMARTRLAVGRVIQLPFYLVSQLLEEDPPRIRPAAPDEVVTPTTGAIYPNAPGFQDTDTSRQAAEDVGRKSKDIQAQVLAAVGRQGDFGATAEELAAILRLPRGTVQPRTTELSRLGKLKDSGKRRQNLSSGKMAIVWVTSVEGANAIPDGTGARDIGRERRRQINKEGWTPDHDDAHGDGALAEAAVCYALARDSSYPQPRRWPWDASWWKPRSHRQNLVRAGALIAAEIDRLDRAAAKAK
jgi:hypothetical protein